MSSAGKSNANAVLTVLGSEHADIQEIIDAAKATKYCSVSTCRKRGSSSRCVHCPDVHYCSKDCQLAHWKLHKSVCIGKIKAAAGQGQKALDEAKAVVAAAYSAGL